MIEQALRRLSPAAAYFDLVRGVWYFGEGQSSARHSSVAQWQSIRLLTEGL